MRKFDFKIPFFDAKGLSNHLAFALLLQFNFLDLTEEVRSEDEVVEAFVVGTHDFVLRAFPFAIAFVDIEDMFADAHDGIHVVGVDDGGRVILLRELMDEFVDDERCLGVETGVGFVAEEILGLEGDGPRNGHAFLHTARDFTGELGSCLAEVDTVEAELGTAHTFLIGIIGEHVEGEHDVFKHRHGVEKGCTLENHSHLATEKGTLALGHAYKATPIVDNIASSWSEEPYDAFHQHSLARTALSDDEVRLAVFESGGDALEHFTSVKRFMEIGDFYHERSWVRKRSENRMSMEHETTALVLAFPTSMLPPSTV